MGCDVVSFRTDFPAQPFARAPTKATINEKATVEGYLVQPDGTQPDCGGALRLCGPITEIGRGEGCNRDRLSLDLQRCPRQLNGMSGGPVTVIRDGRRAALAVFNGAPSKDGGPPFVATTL